MTSFVTVFYVFWMTAACQPNFMSQLLHKALYFQFKYPFLDFPTYGLFYLDLPC